MSPVDASSWIEALGWSLLHFLWQGVGVGVLFALVRALLPREQSGARYASGLFALGMLALCPLVTLWSLRPLAEPSAGGLASVVASGSLPVASVDGGVLDAANAWLPWLVAAWICGVALMSARALVQWRGLERIATQLAWRQADLDDLLVRVGARFGGLGRVRVLVSRHIDTPTLIGWIHPVILLPASVALGFPRQQIELILAHELGHLRRYDHLVNLGQAVIETLLFYHPVVHWISREVRHEREVCCDNLVLRLTESEPREYARTLAALEDVRHLPPQLVVAASGGMLLDRVRRILGSTPPSHASHPRSRVRWLGALAVVGVLVMATLVARREPEEALAPIVRAPIDFNDDAWALMPALDLPIARPAFPVLKSASVEPARAVDVVPTSIPQAAAVSASVDELASLPASMPVMATPIAVETALEVTDVDAPMRTVAVAPPVVVESRPRPSLVRRVDPVYPDVNVSDSRGHVEFEFAITGEGQVRDITVVSGDSMGGFAVAARRALRQWRFAPHSAQARSGERFRQDFAFVGISRGSVNVDDPACPRGTGSHLCRPPRSFGVTTEVEVGRVDGASPVVAIGEPAAGRIGEVALAAPASAQPETGNTP